MPSRHRLTRVLAALIVAVTAPLGAQSPTHAAALGGVRWRELGPAVVGGRIAALAVDERRPATLYVGTASGGLWKTTSAGASWEPIFDDQPTASIGDVALAPSNPNVVWVGTGEPQNRQSSPWGAGVFRSTDAGRTWTALGLTDTKHIGRVVVHPTDPDIAYVAAVGHLWGPNPERGVYRTRDGGRTWDHVLFIDEHTGAIDLVMDPQDPRTLFAALYQRRRTGFGFNGGGPGSGIHRTTDGGASWTELTAGLPVGDKGRIGLAVYRGDGNLVYAVVQASRGDGAGPGVYRSRDRGDTWEHLSATNPRPMYYSRVWIDPSDPERIYLAGTNLMVSEDGGRTFRDDGAPGVHVDHHALWINPRNGDHLILGSDGGVSTSHDRGAHWRMFDNLPIGQFYQVGVDHRDPFYVCGGLQDNSAWCAPTNTRTRYGIRNGDWYDIWGGDGFFTVVDPTDHTVVFTESQGGNIGRYDVTTGERQRLRPVARPNEDGSDREYRWNWNAPIVMSLRDPATVYVGANVLLRTTDRGLRWEEVSPDLTRAIDRDTLPIMGVHPGNATLSRHDGIRAYGTITTIAESPFDGNVLYVGTDDGLVQVTQDGGQSWNAVTSRIPDLPERTYVSRIVASAHAPGRVYAAFDGHRNDDYAPYVYVSEDYGRRWSQRTTGLPDGWSVNVIVEHPEAASLLFVGNEVGVFASTDRGNSWHRLGGLPTVPVDDLVIHPREHELVVGTHGRSIWIAPDLEPLKTLAHDAVGPDLHLYPPKPVTAWAVAGGWPFAAATFSAPNPPVAATVTFSIGPALASDSLGPAMTVLDADGDTVRTLDTPAGAGLHHVTWDLRYPAPGEANPPPRFGGQATAPRVPAGAYTVRLATGGHEAEQTIEVRADPRQRVETAARRARQAFLMRVHQLAPSFSATGEALTRLIDQVTDIQALLGEHGDTAEALVGHADSVLAHLAALREDWGEVGRWLRSARGAEAWSGVPTADQEWALERAWSGAHDLIAAVNDVIIDGLPALNRELNTLGVRPDPGAPIVPPGRPGG